MAELVLDRATDPEATMAGRRRLTSRVIIYGILVIFALIYVVPLVIVVLNSFREQAEMYAFMLDQLGVK